MPWVIALVSPILAKILVLLGFGIITYTGASTFIGAVTQYISGSLAISSPYIGLLYYSGAPQAISLMISAFTASLALRNLRRIQSIL